MKSFKVFQQCHPIVGGDIQVRDSETGKLRTSKEWLTNLVQVGTIEAPNSSAAIEQSRREFKAFRMAPRNTLGAFPIVEEIPEKTPGRQLLEAKVLGAFTH